MLEIRDSSSDLISLEGTTVNDKTGNQITMLDDEELEPVTGGSGEPIVPGAQRGPGPSPRSQTGGIPAPVPSVSSASFGLACWKSANMEHVFVINERGDEVCIYCGAARPLLL